MLADQIYRFYTRLALPDLSALGVHWLKPLAEPAVRSVFRSFLDKYYPDELQRIPILGINPGRFGAGVTAINFTAPKQLQQDCGIPHAWGNQSELSAEFIYQVIHAYGGPAAFYKQCWLGSVCPLGLIAEGKNLNYYDRPDILPKLRPHLLKAIDQQMQWCRGTTCICIGGEKNFKTLSSLNEQGQWFKQILPLPHPRFIMQYRRKQIPAFIDQYLAAFEQAGGSSILG